MPSLSILSLPKETLFRNIFHGEVQTVWTEVLRKIPPDASFEAIRANATTPDLSETLKVFETFYSYVHTFHKNGTTSDNILAIESYVKNYLPYPTKSWNRVYSCMGMEIAHSNCFCGRCTCFAPGCMIIMRDGRPKHVEDMVAGDEVASGARIVCKLVMDIPSKHTDLVTIGPSLTLTPYHPIRIRPNGLWTFPKDVQPIQANAPCERVYNFVLDTGHVLDTVEGYQCVTLAHGMTEPVVAHPYFGTDAVLRDIRAEKGWYKGLVHYCPMAIERDPKTNLVCRTYNLADA